MSTIFKSGLYSIFSNSTIVNKNMSEPFLTENNNRYFHAPLPQPLCSPNYSVTNLTQPEILNLLSLRVKT